MTESKLTPELLQALEATPEGPARVDLLTKLLVTEGHDRYEDTVFELGLIGARNAVPAIVKAANTPFQEFIRWGNLQEFRRKCAYALARIGTDESRAALQGMANSSDVDLRE
ncbi:HEAT repeat domain-containing protein [Massilia forsythiae]|uniref:HEAT repeat domain-containing protein n=1 Tax=Massilia forsythiae TaxID=2728020 RepID=UPI00351CBB9A